MRLERRARETGDSGVAAGGPERKTAMKTGMVLVMIGMLAGTLGIAHQTRAADVDFTVGGGSTVSAYPYGGETQTGLGIRTSIVAPPPSAFSLSFGDAPYCFDFFEIWTHEGTFETSNDDVHHLITAMLDLSPPVAPVVFTGVTYASDSGGAHGLVEWDNNGLVSVSLYVSILAGVFQLQQGGEFGLGATLVALGSLAALMAYKWKEIKAPPGERTLVVLIETLETITGYVSNTLSFLRVAAFSLNHVALAIAVFTLAEMMDVTGHWITVILGNIFIMVLEGAIVTIQALRLEYYEGFSRFFSGDGQEFRPLRLRMGASD